jgi:outer membrane beta-barrel protein
MNPSFTRLLPAVLCCAFALAFAGSAWAQTTAPANPQVVVPEVQRRDLVLPTLPNRDFSLSLFAGTYATQNFGAAAVTGLRLGYHITEDFFAELALGQSTVSDEAFRQVLPGGVFTNAEEKLSYTSLALGVNVLPGEVFFGRGSAKLSAGYLLAGIGSTRFNNQRLQTVTVGAGLRVYLSPRWALQADLRDHIFSLDLLGQRQSTQNLEATAAISFVF